MKRDLRDAGDICISRRREQTAGQVVDDAESNPGVVQPRMGLQLHRTLVVVDRVSKQITDVRRRGARLSAAGAMPWLGDVRLLLANEPDPVNIGNPREMTIKQFAEEIIRITGARSRIDYKPLPVDDPKVRQPDISRAEKVLGWEPKVQFEEGIKKTIEYFRNALKGAGSN